MDGMAVNYLWEPPKPAPGNTPAAESKPASPKPTELRTNFFNYRLIEPGIAYVDFFNMWDGLFSAGSFRKALDAMFRRVVSDQPRTLIIDLRNNGGGDDGIAGELFRHITEKPFRLSGPSQMKRSKEGRAYGKSMIRIPFRWLPLQYLFAEGRQMYRGEVGSLSPPVERPVRKHERAEPFFAGPTCVLTGPFTFSAAVQMANAMKTYGLTTIVGDETGGHPNAFGSQMPFPLPHSGLSVEIATVRSVPASGDATDFNSVIPDIIVRTTAEDIRAGRDPVLERAKGCPERRGQ
jgi:C-terminal processing protease CtpA/Prc